jgi:hypothetical protein
MVGIYKITNKLNQKCYIGKSIDIETRWGEHTRNAKYVDRQTYNYPLYNAIRKYGIENFVFEILEETISNDEFMYERENYYYDLYKPEYNQMRPERNAADFLRQELLQIDKETLKIVNIFNGVNIAAKQLGISRSGISNVLIGRAKSSNGYYWCLSKDYDSFTKPEPQYEAHRKKVAKIDLESGEVVAIYGSLSEAGEENNLDRRTIGGVTNGKRKSAGGYAWSFI